MDVEDSVCYNDVKTDLYAPLVKRLLLCKLDTKSKFKVNFLGQILSILSGTRWNKLRISQRMIFEEILIWTKVRNFEILLDFGIEFHYLDD